MTMFFLMLLCGIVFWTFMEYVLHRFLGHVHKGNNFFKAEHLTHHSKVNYFAPFYKKIIASFILSIILFFILSLFFSFLPSLGFSLGFYGMYIIYENTHFRYHRFEPLIPPFIILRKHHFYHHFHNPNVNHGVTTRFWDRVFGTFVNVDFVKVPKSMCMSWLLNDDQIKPKYQKHFNLNKR